MNTSECIFELTEIERDAPELAVCVRNGFKKYGFKNDTTVVLKNINLNVPKGAIYGLLGASGSGKTTLLNCIVGLKQLNSGNIYVLGGPPNLQNGAKIGYMPQNLALCLEFTIRESMRYFGWIGGMSFDSIQKQTCFLAELLNLPNIDDRIGDLSGGQQRRVSFATALLHQPELLLLDEPTVGLDPLLRQSIWKYLLEISESKSVTIVFTTHYINEAHQADKIGLIRNGLIISEEAPKTLVEKLNVNNLEEAFYQLVASEKEETLVNKYLRFPEEIKRDNHGHIVKRHVLTGLMWKNFLWMWRNFLFVFSIFILPVVTAYAYGHAFGGNAINLTFAIVNYETNISNCQPLLCNSTLLSCHFLRYLKQNNINFDYYEDEDQALLAVQNGHASASVVIRHNYTDNLKIRLKTWHLTNLNINQSTIDVVRDTTVKHISLYIQMLMYKSFNGFIEDYLRICDVPKGKVTLPIKFHKPVYGLAEPNMRDFANPGVILSLAFFMAIAAAGGTTIIERCEGILERTLVTGVSYTEILTAHVLCQSGIMIIQSLTPLLIVFLIFNLTLNGSVTNVIIFAILSGFCGMSAGFALSSLCNGEKSVCYAILGMFLPMVFFSGFLWPLEGMNYYARIVSRMLPLTVANESLRCILQKGWGLNEVVVYKGLIIINVWIIIFFIITVVGLKLKKN